MAQQPTQRGGQAGFGEDNQPDQAPKPGASSGGGGQDEFGDDNPPDNAPRQPPAGGGNAGTSGGSG